MFNIAISNKNDSWALFCYHAFSRLHSTSLPQKLVDIGRDIVQKCNGVPLVIRALGCLLARETKEEVWVEILGSNVWALEECKMSIIPILELSYRLLPSHLKPCFTYCAAFPKGYVFELENLVHLWLAQGFIKKQPREQMEEIGQVYAHDLLQRSLFQTVSNTGSAHKLTMHDLMHDLAQAISCQEIHVTVNEQLNEICGRKKLHHLTVLVNSKGSVFLERCLEGLSLKSLIIIGSNKANFLLEESFFDNPCFTSLRVLDLNFWESDEVPESISNLKHLRYLALSGQKLPDSIGNLYHLETLNMRAAMGLPKNINCLVNLRHLLFDPWCISKIPQGIGDLSNIQSLSSFPLVGSQEAASLEELKELNNLRGKLHISNLDHTMVRQAREANLNNKKHLNHLILSCRKEFLRFKDKRYVLSELFELLQPHTNIEHITVGFYEGEKLPSWLEEPSFSNLTNIELVDCTECKQLPAIGQLMCLKHLKLESFSSLECVGSEILGNKTIAFPSLEVLCIYNMPVLKKWCYGVERTMVFPRLREVHLSLCASLNMFKLPLFSPLDKFNVSWCNSLETILGLEGSWSVIAQWRSLLDFPKTPYDENLSRENYKTPYDENSSTENYKSIILDSHVLKLQKDSETGKPLLANLILTIVGCRLLQNSYLTCTDVKVRVIKPSNEDTLPLVVEESDGFTKTYLKCSQMTMRDSIISEAELEPELFSTTPKSLLGTTKNLQRFILRYDSSMIYHADMSERTPITEPIGMVATEITTDQKGRHTSIL